jgi:enoyl-CoA hydratase/carnithine racemase
VTQSGVRIDEGLNGVSVITIDNPPANLLTQEIVDQLSLNISRFIKNSDARVLIITGSGDKFFIGGVSLTEIANISSAAIGKRLAERGQNLCNQIEASEKPIITAINGFCIGGGNEIAISSHIRIAASNATFQQPETYLGIIPGFGGTQRLPRLVGPSAARMMILAGEKLNAAEALRIGLIDEIVSKGSALNQARRIADMISSKSPSAIRCANRAIRASSGDASHGMKAELDAFYDTCNTGDMKEAFAAFKEKRRPNFDGGSK